MYYNEDERLRALTEVTIAEGQIQEYLNSLSERGCKKETVKTYRRGLIRFYEMLPENKMLRRDTLEKWRNELRLAGYMPRTINLLFSSVNGFLAFLGLWEFQYTPPDYRFDNDIQPEISRAEYLRLLTAAKNLGKLQTYLLIKVFAIVGIAVRELPSVTVEAAQMGRVVIETDNDTNVRKIPECLGRELLDYACEKSIRDGPIFVTRTGRQISRTTVSALIQSLSDTAKVAPEKCNPRCLRKLYLSTNENIMMNMTFIAEQAYIRLLEKEQLKIGWNLG